MMHRNKIECESPMAVEIFTGIPPSLFPFMPQLSPQPHLAVRGIPNLPADFPVS